MRTFLANEPVSLLGARELGPGRKRLMASDIDPVHVAANEPLLNITTGCMRDGAVGGPWARPHSGHAPPVSDAWLRWRRLN